MSGRLVAHLEAAGLEVGRKADIDVYDDMMTLDLTQMKDGWPGYLAGITLRRPEMLQLRDAFNEALGDR